MTWPVSISLLVCGVCAPGHSELSTVHLTGWGPSSRVPLRSESFRNKSLLHGLARRESEQSETRQLTALAVLRHPFQKTSLRRTVGHSS